MAERVFLSAPKSLPDGNALLRHPAERGAWIWHPEKSALQTAVLRFRLEFHLSKKINPLIHITADQRFQFRCDGRDVSFGPDRCDLDHWTIQSLRLELASGAHEFEVLAWWIAPPTDTCLDAVSPPMAQVTWRGGFLLHTEEAGDARLNTGSARWLVDDLTDAVGMGMPRLPNYHDVGPCFEFDMVRWPLRENKNAKIIRPPLESNAFGLRRPGWCLYPAELPEQSREPWRGGRIRAFRGGWGNQPFTGDETRSAEISAWQNLITEGTTLSVPAHSLVTVLWDFENYHCGYPVVEAADGDGSVIEWSWAEALYEEVDPTKVTDKSSKGQRDRIEGKVFVGMGDRWKVGMAFHETSPSLWWRAGRYVRLRIKAEETPLVISRLSVITTGYPLRLAGSWKSSDSCWDRLTSLFIHAFQCSAHETWTDTPYYEQMCYVGDTLMHAAANYAWFADDRLSRRAIRLFEWSRRFSGLVAERYPSRQRQESATYSLLWPRMVRDYAWWRDDPLFVREMLPGIRSVLAEFEGMCEDGLLHQVPGWPFVDWVSEWSTAPSCHGYGPGVAEGDSSIVNLHWVLALLAAAQIEEAHGDPLLGTRDRRLARSVFDLVVTRYWDEGRGLLLDSRGSIACSEHAQVLALLTGLLDPEKTERCLSALCMAQGLAKSTIAFSFFLLDVLYQHGREGEFHRRLQFWRVLPDQGFTSTPEGPEPSRSDAHAWGAHPAWHTLASIAGIRPDSPGFATVRIAPMPGGLDHFDAVCVHPRGRIKVGFRRDVSGSAECYFRVCLPAGITGTLVWSGCSRSLVPGMNSISFSKTPVSAALYFPV